MEANKMELRDVDKKGGISLPAVFGAGVTLLKKIVTSSKFWITAGIVLAVVGVPSLFCLFFPIIVLSLGGTICFIIGLIFLLTGGGFIGLGAAIREEEQEKKRLPLAYSREFNGDGPPPISVKKKPSEETE
ncbi:MAG: hypothetical protein LBT98_03790 [Puniceicoccales bacterium]|jgi:hypothetical protein|nr:hypothetical protein [Puniceicoccales bacterium]